MAILKKQDKNKKHFVGRRDLIDTYETLSKNARTRQATVLNFYGMGGIGKSTLLKEIQTEALENGSQVFYYDFKENESSVSIAKYYESICIWLEKNKIKAHYLPLAYMIYFRSLHPMTASNENIPPFMKEGGLYADLAQLVVESNLIPAAGSVMKHAYKGYKYLSTKVTFDKSILLQIKELEELTQEEIEEKLAYFLLQDLLKINKNKQKYDIIFLFDTYEHYTKSIISYSTSDWVQELVSELENNCFFVISGKEKLLWEEDIWKGFIFSHKLESLDFDESLNLVKRLGVIEDEIAYEIVSSSKGVPFYISILVETYHKSTQKNIEDFRNLNPDKIVNRLISHIDKNEKFILAYLSFLRFFDEEIFTHITQTMSMTNISFSQITQYSFFSEKDGLVFMHDLVRDAFSKTEAVQYAIDANKIMFSYYDNKLLYKEKNLSENATKQIKEALYHLLFLEQEAIKVWMKKINQWLYITGEYSLLSQIYEGIIEQTLSIDFKVECLIDLGELYTNLDNYRKAKAIATQLKYMNLPNYLIDKYDYLHAKIQLKHAENTWGETRKKEMDLANKKFENTIAKTNSNDLKAQSCIKIANILRKNKKIFHAKSHLYTALNTTDNDLLVAEIHDKLGYVYRDTKEYALAKENFYKAIGIKNRILPSNHIELGKSYRGLLDILSITKGKGLIETSIKTINIFSSFYGADSKHVYAEYARLVNVTSEKLGLLEQAFKLDPLVLNISLITRAIKDGTDYEIYIDTLNALPLRKTNLFCKLAKVLFHADKPRAYQYLEEALACANSHEERCRVHIQSFELHKKINQDKAIEALNALHLVSKEMKLKYHIGQLKRSSAFYKQKRENKREEDVYLLILNLLKNSNHQEEKAPIYSYLYNLKRRCQDYKSAQFYLEEEITIWQDKKVYYKVAEKKSFLAQHFILTKDYSKSEVTFYEVIEIYQKLDDTNRVDMTYGKLIELYKTTYNKEKSLVCYHKQLEIREKGNDPIKLSKAYKFLADFYFNILNDHKEAQYCYERAIAVVQETKDLDTKEVLIKSLVALMQFYTDTQDKEKHYQTILSRIKITQNFNMKREELNAYNDLRGYYKKYNNIQKEEEAYLSQLAITNHRTFEKERLRVIQSIISFYKTNNMLKDTLAYDFEVYKLLLEQADYEKANNSFNHNLLSKYNAQEYNKMHFLGLYKNILNELLKTNRYKAYAAALGAYKKLDYKGTRSFVNEQLLFLINNSKNYKKIHQINKHLHEDKHIFEASIFYYAYFDLYLKELKGNMNEQKLFYEKALPVMQSLSNDSLYKKTFLRYEKLVKRLENSYIVNGVIIDTILKNVIQEFHMLKVQEEVDDIKIDKIIELFTNEEKVRQKIVDNEARLALLIQAIMACIKDFNSINLGFASNVEYLQYKLANTKFFIGTKKQSNDTTEHILEKDNFDSDVFLAKKEITNKNDFIHTSENYKKILKKLFDEGAGIFISEDIDTSKAVYDFLSANTIDSISFFELVESISHQYSFDKSQIYLTKNLIKNLHYANTFFVDKPFEDIEENILSLRIERKNILQNLKDFGKKRLENTLGEINGYNYSKLLVAPT